MKRKLLILRICFVLLLIATLGVCCWEVYASLAIPSPDHYYINPAITIFIASIFWLISAWIQWECYRSLKYFLTAEARTTERTISNAVALGFSSLALVIGGASYFVFTNITRDAYTFVLTTAGVLVCNRLILGIYIEHKTPWYYSKCSNLWRITKNVLRYVVVIPLGFGCVMMLVHLLGR